MTGSGEMQPGNRFRSVLSRATDRIMSSIDKARPDIAVVGGGPAGLMAALALATAGVPVTLVARMAAVDNRTSALLAGSVSALETIGVWPRCRAQSAPLSVMRIVDDTGRLVRAPETRFDAAEIGLEAFGYNIANRDLVAAMLETARMLSALTIVDDVVDAVEIGASNVTLTLAGGATLTPRLVIGADGRRSLCREAVGIVLDTHAYPQSALTLTFAHSRDHGFTSTEFHTPSGPFTLVPLPGRRSSLVWVLQPKEAERIAALDDAALAALVEEKSQSILGKIALDGERGLFPLSVATASRFAANRIALVGEAGHIIPPIGAQGLNLGLRDAAAIAEIAADAVRRGDDPGADDGLSAYDQARHQDITRRSLAVDLLNRSLLTDFLPVQSARGVGLYLLDRIGPLRRAVMREGVAPAGSAPRLMRGEPV